MKTMGSHCKRTRQNRFHIASAKDHRIVHQIPGKCIQEEPSESPLVQVLPLPTAELAFIRVNVNA
jgi:hypothetical protein